MEYELSPITESISVSGNQKDSSNNLIRIEKDSKNIAIRNQNKMLLSISIKNFEKMLKQVGYTSSK